MAKRHLTLVLPHYAGLLDEINRAELTPYLRRLLTKGVFQPSADSLDKHLFNLFTANDASATDLPMAALRETKGQKLCADPCYIHPDRDQLILFKDELAITPPEAEQLITALQPLFAEFSASLQQHQTDQWLLDIASMPKVEFTAMSELNGRSLRQHLPTGPEAKKWIRLWNEIQMLLFDLPLNQQREAAGQLPINSVWFWGGAPLVKSAQTWDGVLGDYPLLKQLAEWHQSPYQADITTVNSRYSGQILYLIEALDWQKELASQLISLEKSVFKPLWQQLKYGKLNHLTLIIPQQGCYQLKPWHCWRIF